MLTTVPAYKFKTKLTSVKSEYRILYIVEILRSTDNSNHFNIILESAQGWIAQPAAMRGVWVGRGRGKKHRTYTRARTDKMTNRHTHKARPIHPRYVGCKHD